MSAPAPVPVQPDPVADSPVEQAGTKESQAVTDRSIGESVPPSSGEGETPAVAETRGTGLEKQHSSGSQGPERPVLDRSASSSKWKSGTKVKVCMYLCISVLCVHTFVRVHGRQFGLLVQQSDVWDPHQRTVR